MLPIPAERLSSLVKTLQAYPSEKPWAEFKVGNCDPEMIGEDISAISNAAALHNKPMGFMVWGIKNDNHQIVGTEFVPHECKKGNQNIDLWVSTQLDPQIMFFFHLISIENKSVVVFEIQAANSTQVKFKGIEYIRVETNAKKLNDYPQIEQELREIFSRSSFGIGSSMDGCSGDDVLKVIDYPSYFDLISLNLPSNKKNIISALANDNPVRENMAGGYDITNLGAVLFAKKVSDFQSISRKSVRVIIYDGNGRQKTIKEQIGVKGYAAGFEGLISYINQ